MTGTIKKDIIHAKGFDIGIYTTVKSRQDLQIPPIFTITLKKGV